MKDTAFGIITIKFHSRPLQRLFCFLNTRLAFSVYGRVPPPSHLINFRKTDRMESKKITLLALLRHSKKRVQVSILDSFTVDILPWSALQIEELAPILQLLLKEFRMVWEEEKEHLRNRNFWDAILTLLSKKELYKDVLKVIHTTLERGNETLVVTDPETQEKIQVPLFSLEELQQYLPVDAIIKILKAIYEVNVSSNPTLASKLTEEEKPPIRLEPVN